MKYIFKLRNEYDGGAARTLSEETGIDGMLAKILSSRGVRTAGEAERFFHPKREDLHDPFLFRDMRAAVSLIERSVSEGQKIIVYGDYDVDGTAACAIMYNALKRMGADASCVLPSRMEHGYGLSVEAVGDMAGCGLLITVDCGITNIAEIRHAKSLGLKVIISDHHECGEELPDADCILNPKRPGETYPFRELCGAGIAFKIAAALTGEEAYSCIDLAAVATIADIVPLIKENRTIAGLGLEKLNADPNPGIKALIAKAGVKAPVASGDVAYNIAPRLNAAGRISSAVITLDLMISGDPGEAGRLADQLCALNEERRRTQWRIIDEAVGMEKNGDSGKFILLHKPEWDVGVIGLAATKVVEKYNKPALLLGKVGESYVGSARSIEGINIYEALASKKELFEKFGGHSGAAGLTISGDKLEGLREDIDAFLSESYGGEAFMPVKYYDIALSVRDITPALISGLEMLAPFGYRNEQVEILIENAVITGVRPIGDGRHSKFTIEKDKARINAVCFGVMADEVPDCADVSGHAEINSYDGLPQFIVRTLSFSPPGEAGYTKARDALKGDGGGYGSEDLFLNREKLLTVYMLLKKAEGESVLPAGTDSLIGFMAERISWLSPEKLAFALAVLEEINLIEIKNDGRIHLKAQGGKKDLNDSSVYRKYFMEEL